MTTIEEGAGAGEICMSRAGSLSRKDSQWLHGLWISSEYFHY